MHYEDSIQVYTVRSSRLTATRDMSCFATLCLPFFHWRFTIWDPKYITRVLIPWQLKF